MSARAAAKSAREYPGASGKVVNALAMAASHDPNSSQLLGIRLPTLDTSEVIKERWANWLRQDPVVATEAQAHDLRGLKALYIDCGKNDQFSLLYGARRFVRRPNELPIEAVSRTAARGQTAESGRFP